MTESARLLSPATNYAVVQLPGRKFPGVVFQGDSLYALEQEISKIAIMAKQHNEEIADELKYTSEAIHDILLHYESVCKKHGISLPYFRKR
jgi:hypothetical protein